MKAGKLRHRVTIQNPPGATKNSLGEPSDTWTDFCTVWAEIRPLTVREQILAQSNQSSVTHEIIMRWRAGIVAKQRAQFNGRTFDIIGVRNIEERNTELRLMCAEGLRA